MMFRPLINRNGWVLLGIVAIGAIAIYALSNWRECEHTEYREVEVLHNGRFNHGLRKHRYKVCLDNAQPKDENIVNIP